MCYSMEADVVLVCRGLVCRMYLGAVSVVASFSSMICLLFLKSWFLNWMCEHLSRSKFSNEYWPTKLEC